MPDFIGTKTLCYVERQNDIAELACAIDLIGHHDVFKALEVLMALRNRWQDEQKPHVVDYDPREEQRVAKAL